MNTRLTLFTATLVQDSALSVSGLDRETSADQPFALVGGVPTLVGRGLKGAAVAMARRFFDPLPRAVSDDIKHGALRRSAWEFSDATTTGKPALRAGVGIRQKTGARAGRVLYDREVMPAGTRWELSFRVDRSYALDGAEFTEAEGILGYVLADHWAKGRCWLGGGAARGLGWCHIEDLKAYRFDEVSYEQWVKLGRPRQPHVGAVAVPVVSPTRSWCFRTLDVDVAFGEHKPEPDEAAWGLDMFAVGPHDTDRALQPTGDGLWAKPAWATNAQMPDTLVTDRALLMDGGRPLLPGASVRGPLRHAFSHLERAKGRDVKDPHLVQGNVGEDDPAGKAFGTVSKSSHILIRDARAEGEWAAAKLHMHAEDEFSAGSYGSAKRDAVRVLKGTFPVRIVVEGADPPRRHAQQSPPTCPTGRLRRLVGLEPAGEPGLWGRAGPVASTLKGVLVRAGQGLGMDFRCRRWGWLCLTAGKRCFATLGKVPLPPRAIPWERQRRPTSVRGHAQKQKPPQKHKMVANENLTVILCVTLRRSVAILRALPI